MRKHHRVIAVREWRLDAGNGCCVPNSPQHSRQTRPLRNSFATMQTGCGRSPERPASAGMA